MNIFNFRITNLTCEACIKLSTMALKNIPGVSDVNIDLGSGRSQLQSSDITTWDQITVALQSVGKNAVKL